MHFSDRSDKILKNFTVKDPISTHRAFVYGACGPGFGEIYAGARLRGYATLLLFLFFTVWFTWSLFDVIRIFVNRLFDSLNGAAPFVLPEASFTAVAISFFGIYFTWLWAMLSSVQAAAGSRQKAGEAAQASVGWAAAIAWFCPGAGHVYAAERRFGYILFGAYLLGILLIVPPYLKMFAKPGRAGQKRSAVGPRSFCSYPHRPRAYHPGELQLRQALPGRRQVFVRRRHPGRPAARPLERRHKLAEAVDRIRCRTSGTRMALSGIRPIAAGTRQARMGIFYRICRHRAAHRIAARPGLYNRSECR